MADDKDKTEKIEKAKDAKDAAPPLGASQQRYHKVKVRAVPRRDQNAYPHYMVPTHDMKGAQVPVGGEPVEDVLVTEQQLQGMKQDPFIIIMSVQEVSDPRVLSREGVGEEKDLRPPLGPPIPGPGPSMGPPPNAAATEQDLKTDFNDNQAGKKGFRK